MKTDSRPTLAQALAGFVEDLHFEDIPASVREKAKLHLLDTLGVMLAGSRLESAAVANSVAREMGGREEATTIAFGTRLPAALAAMVNGTMAHGLDYDDTHSESVTHTSAPVVSTALAMAERQGVGGAQMMVGAIAGYEVTTRIGAAAPNGFHNRGFHATGVCGAFGAAAIAGKLLNLDSVRMSYALGIAGSQASGITEHRKEGAWVKRLHPGWAAHAGIVAALLAERGFTGPSTVLDGDCGLFRSHLDPGPFDLDRVLRGLGSEWAMPDISVKLYPACHHNHGLLDAVLELRRRHEIRPEDVREIVCYVPQEAVRVVCEPAESKVAPVSAYAAKFSLPYCMAAAMVEGHGLAGAFEERLLQDARILELARKVGYKLDPDTLFPAAYGGAVDLVLKDGRSYHLRVPACKGSPQNPPTADDIASKFFANVEGVLATKDARRLRDLVLEVDSLPTLAPLIDLCRAPEEA